MNKKALTQLAKISPGIADAIENGEIGVNDMDGTGLSLIGLLCQDDVPGLIKALVEDLNADARLVDGRGLLPIQHAILNGSIKVVEYLLRFSKDMEDSSNRFGASLLHFAAQAEEGADSIVNFLLARGASVNAKDNDGNTPLIFAAISGKNSVIQILLEAGADPSIRNDAGINAAEQAKECPEIVSLLEPNNNGHGRHA
jgi:uncharacterized protein